MKLFDKIKTVAIAIALMVVGVSAIASNVYAENTCTCSNSGGKVTYSGCKNEAEKGMALASGCVSKPTNLEDSVKNIINGVLYVVGILAVVMVIIGGVKYTTSGGDQSAVTSAKNTILYGIVGLVIAILAYAIVNFVIERV